MNRFWCQLAQVVDGTRTWNDQLWGQEVKGQGQSHARTRPKIDWRLSGRIILDPLSPVVFLVLVCLKFKMADLRHLETREIAISQRKIIWFWWNLVHECRFGTRWQHVTKYENFLKFKMADGRCFKNRFLVITQQPIVRFQWNFVWGSSFSQKVGNGTVWQIAPFHWTYFCFPNAVLAFHIRYTCY